MSRPKTAQELIHWLEEGAGARRVALAAVLAVTVALSLWLAWVRFHGATSEATLIQADTGRQLARGEGFTTLVNYPQASAFLAQRGGRFDPAKPYPELYQPPLYSIVIAASLRAFPAGMRDSLFKDGSIPPGGGFGADYFLLGLNLLLFWLAAALTFGLGRRLFDVRTGALAAGALLVSVGAWQQTLAVNGAPLLMVLALAAFWILARLEGQEGEPAPRAGGWHLALGAVCGLLFLAEYTAGTLVLVVLGYVAWRQEGRPRWASLALVVAGFALVAGPWIVRNLTLTGYPVALAVQDVALKAGDPTAEPATWRAMLAAKLPSVDLAKLGNKTLTSLQESLQMRLWSGGGLWLTAFFVAGWLYGFRAVVANRLRWTFTVALGVLLVTQAVFNSGESDRLVATWLAPLVAIFGAGFFFVLLSGSNLALAAWPRAAAVVLLLLQAAPLVHDVLEPRRQHFHYPPYFPALFIGVREELARRNGTGRFGVMADVPAGAAWYGRQRVWAQPASLRDFYRVNVEQPIGLLLLTPRTLDRPFFSELAPRPSTAGQAAASGQPGDWGRIYGGIYAGTFPAEFPLGVTQRVADNLYVLLNPALPPPRGK